MVLSNGGVDDGSDLSHHERSLRIVLTSAFTLKERKKKEEFSHNSQQDTLKLDTLALTSSLAAR